MNPSIPAHMIDAAQAYPVGDDECVDRDGEVYPEHDFPPVEEGNECRRCGAEADPVDEDGEETDKALDARLSSALSALRDVTGTN